MGKTIAIDFDGTVVYDRVGPLLTENLKLNIQNVLRRLRKEGNILILYTCRVNECLEEALIFLQINRIKFDHINDNPFERIQKRKRSRKVYADIYIDDRQLGGIPDDWEEIYKIIKEYDR